MKKFFMFFLMSFILITSSYALEFNAVPNPETGTSTVSTDNSDLTAFEEMFKADTGYTVSQIVAIAEYKTSTDTELVQAYTTAMNSLSSKGYHYMYGSFQPYGQATRHYRRFIKTSTGFDFGVYATYNSRSTRCLLNEGDLIYITGYSKNLSTVTSSGLFKFDYVSTFHNTKLKKITSDNVWTESNGYYFEPTLCNAVGDVSVPDTPLSNYDLAGLITAITSSDVIKDNTNGYLSDYFIIPKGTVGDEEVYSVYFYHKLVNLSKFDYVYEDVNYYDLDKLSGDNGVINILDHYRKSFESDILDKARHFTIYYNPNTKASDIYLTSNTITLNNLKSFLSDSEPIIYTTKLIKGYFATWGETDTEWTATEDSTRDILVTEVSDSEGNVISPSVTSDVSDLSEIPFFRFISNLLNGIKGLFTINFDAFFDTWNKFQQKASFLGETKDLVSNEVKKIELNPQEPPSITVDLTSANSKYNWGTQAICLDLSWYTAFKPKVDFFIICFCYGFFFWNLFKDLPNVINGIAGVGIAHNSSSIRDNYIKDRAERIANKTKR